MYGDLQEDKGYKRYHMIVMDDTHMPSYSVLYWSRLMKTTLTAMQSVMKSSTNGSNTMMESTSEILIQA